jgi:hypothetical protein
LGILNLPDLFLWIARKNLREALRAPSILLLLSWWHSLLGLVQTLGTFVAQPLARRADPWAVGLKMIFEPTSITSANKFKRNILGRDKRQIEHVHDFLLTIPRLPLILHNFKGLNR